MPKQKAYVILHDGTNKTFTFPLKAAHSPYGAHLDFAQGAPQFFGGNREGNRPLLEDLSDEVTQESQQSLALNNTATLTPVLTGLTDTKGNTYDFYETGDYTVVGPRQAPRNKSEEETDGIVTLQLADFAGHMSDKATFLTRLHSLAGTSGASGKSQFDSSHTADAFFAFVSKYV